jgi:hypothetical protein
VLERRAVAAKYGRFMTRDTRKFFAVAVVAWASWPY